MDDLSIGKALEKQQATQQEQEVKAALQKPANADDSADDSKEGKRLLIMIMVIVGAFILLFAGFAAYNKITAANVVNVDELHQENLGGELDDEEGYVYNGYSFVKADGLWWTEMNKFGTLLKVPLHFGPKELEDIPITGTLNPKFNDGEQLYVAIDPDVNDKYYSLALSELSFNIVKGLDREPVGSCTKENWACDNRTIVSCNNTQGKAVVELSLEEGPGIELQGTCIKVKGNYQYDIVKSVNRLLYQWYGVME